MAELPGANCYFTLKKCTYCDFPSQSLTNKSVSILLNFMSVNKLNLRLKESLTCVINTYNFCNNINC